MKHLIKKLLRYSLIPFVINDYMNFRKSDKEKRFTISIPDFYPQIKDKTIKTGFDRHYIYHIAWAMRVLSENKPEKHIDISSSLHFCASLSAFIPTEFYDYRPADLGLSNLDTGKADLTNLRFEDSSIKSLSCMHTVEHIGLGRYGDPIDPTGDIKAAKELSRVLASEGQLLFVVPIGNKSKIEWNAHRIYTYDDVLALFPTLTLKEFSLIPENEKDGGLIRNADKKLLDKENYACGCFLFTK